MKFECDCPVKGVGLGCSCRHARYPQLHYASDEWCNCECHLDGKGLAARQEAIDELARLGGWAELLRRAEPGRAN